MGQTLTHGVYLPDEGERNCYSGLAGNWTILDNSVGTIAEHTTQIAGKANAVHTHTKSDITDFPAYGNAAGTICEGNDSRLSDARTPVAHTHGKADITDLFNSANTWSALNTYLNGQIRIKSLSQEIGVTPASSIIQYLEFADKNDAQHGIVGLWDYANGTSEIQMYISDKFKNGAKDPTGTSETTILSFGFKADGSKFLTFSGQVDNSVIPKSNNTYDLGSSSYQWNNLYAKKVNTQSVNGINPGALGLPDLNTAQTIDRTGWAYDGSTYNSIKLSSTDTNMTKNGWLYVRISSTGSSDKLSIKYNSIGDKYPTSSFGDTGGCIEVFVPVIANSNVYLCATKDLQFCKFYPCLGNVPSGV